ncbi:unnamed protein product [Sphagnum balticum]
MPLRICVDCLSTLSSRLIIHRMIRLSGLIIYIPLMKYWGRQPALVVMFVIGGDAVRCASDYVAFYLPFVVYDSGVHRRLPVPGPVRNTVSTMAANPRSGINFGITHHVQIGNFVLL